jgi:uncharacterized membrane protein YidH (DUF202 family)
MYVLMKETVVAFLKCLASHNLSGGTWVNYKILWRVYSVSRRKFELDMSRTQALPMSIIVQQAATIYSFVIFLQTALHISEDNLIHHREHTQTAIITSGTGQTVFATVRWRGGVRTPRQRKVANSVRTVPDVAITVWVCSWW